MENWQKTYLPNPSAVGPPSPSSGACFLGFFLWTLRINAACAGAGAHSDVINGLLHLLQVPPPNCNPRVPTLQLNIDIQITGNPFISCFSQPVLLPSPCVSAVVARENFGLHVHRSRSCARGTRIIVLQPKTRLPITTAKHLSPAPRPYHPLSALLTSPPSSPASTHSSTRQVKPTKPNLCFN